MARLGYLVAGQASPIIFALQNPRRAIKVAADFSGGGVVVDYFEYLDSDAWREFRTRAIAHYGNVCAKCGKPLTARESRALSRSPQPATTPRILAPRAIAES